MFKKYAGLLSALAVGAAVVLWATCQTYRIQQMHQPYPATEEEYMEEYHRAKDRIDREGQRMHDEWRKATDRAAEEIEADMEGYRRKVEEERRKLKQEGLRGGR
jgi:hypothetical protein